MKSEKMIRVFAVIPHDFEFSVQYVEDRETAERWAETYESGADIVEEVIPARIVRAKQLKTARKGYRV